MLFRSGAAIAAAAAQTPQGTRAVVLGCTEYELVADRIRAAVPGAVPFCSAGAVAAQAVRRAAAATGHSRRGDVHVLLSGRPGRLPPAALRYSEGRLLAAAADGVSVS